MENPRELLILVEAVAKEKNLPKNEIVSILAESVEVAVRKNFPEGALIQVEINDKTGEMQAWRLFEIVSQIENPEAEMLANEVEHEEVLDGYAWDKFELNLTRQQFNIVKQVALQKIKNHSRENYIQQLLTKKLNLHSGVVKANKKDFLVVDTNGIDVTIYKKNLLQKESFKGGDKIRFTLKEIGGHYVGDRASEQFLIELFKEEISYIEDGEIEIVACARNPGFRSKLVVSTKNKKIDPVRFCIGAKGLHIKNIQQEINGEYIDIIQYDENPAQLLVKAIAPVNVSKIIMDEENKIMEIAVEEKDLPLAIGRNGKNIDMISNLINWNIKVHSEEEWESSQSNQIEGLVHYFELGLNCDEELAQYIAEAGIESLDEIAYLSVEELELDELDEETTLALKENAKETLHDKVKVKLVNALKDLYSLGFDKEEVEKLLEENVYSVEDVGDLSVYDLQDYLPTIDTEKAKAIILKCRETQMV